MKILTGPTQTPPRIALIGREGVGKTTFAAAFPSPIFLTAEDGGGDLDTTRAICTSWPELVAAVDHLSRHDHDYQTVVIDTIDAFERHLWAAICRDQRAENIEVVGGGYGKGYTLAAAEHGRLRDALDELRGRRKIAVVIIGHTHSRVYSPPDAPAYDVHQLRMHDKSATGYTQWCDHVLFAHTRVIVDQVKPDGNAAKARGKARNSDPERVLCMTPRPAWVAKNRWNLPDEIPLSWAEFASVSNYASRSAAWRGEDAPVTEADLRAACVAAHKRGVKPEVMLAGPFAAVCSGTVTECIANTPPNQRAATIAALNQLKGE